MNVTISIPDKIPTIAPFDLSFKIYVWLPVMYSNKSNNIVILRNEDTIEIKRNVYSLVSQKSIFEKKRITDSQESIAKNNHIDDIIIYVNRMFVISLIYELNGLNERDNILWINDLLLMKNTL